MNFLKMILSLFSKKSGNTVRWTQYGTEVKMKSNPVLDAMIEMQQKAAESALDSMITESLGTLFLRLKRTTFTGESTIGELYVNNQFECYTLEDHDRLSKGRKKVPGVTAIPKGTYSVSISYSPRFKRQLPLLKDVPGFSGIRIHPGNTAKDTEGCLLVGETRGKDFVGRSRKAFNKLFKRLSKAQEEGKDIQITIEGED